MRTLAFAALFATLSGCAVEGQDAYEVEVPGVDYSNMEKAPPRICPAIAILCVEGYHPQSLPNCRQMCVPDGQADKECDVDADCGTIYCVTEPCPQPVCQGHSCVMPN